MLSTLLPLLTAASLCVAKTGPHLHSHHGPSAQIDLFAPSSSPSPSISSSASLSPIRSASDANALLSSFLGIEEYEHLRTGLEEQAGQLVLLRSSEGQQAEAQRETMMLLLERPMWHNEGKKKKGAYKSDLTTAPVHSFKVSKSPSSDEWKLLLETYAERLQHGSEEGAEGQFRDTMIHGDVVVDHAKMLAEESFMSDDVYQPFLSSIATLLVSAESDEPSTPVHLAGLAEIAAKFGRHSEEYKKAKEMMDVSVQAAITSRLSNNGKVILVTVPSRPIHSGKEHKHAAHALRRRSSSPLSTSFSTVPLSLRQISAPSVPPLVSSSGLCYPSLDECTSSTNACSGHGACVPGQRVGFTSGNKGAQPECYVCQCPATGTKDDAGRTRYYAGPSCAKEDVSAQFFLLAGSTFLLVMVAVASVVILMDVGSKPLPSVLSAMGGVGAGHTKRD